jgi:hypothetical protein
MLFCIVFIYCIILALICHVTELLTIKALFYAGFTDVACGLIDHGFPGCSLFDSSIRCLWGSEFNSNTGIWFIRWWTRAVLEPMYLRDFGLFIPYEGSLHEELRDHCLLVTKVNGFDRDVANNYPPGGHPDHGLLSKPSHPLTCMASQQLGLIGVPCANAEVS